MKKVNTPPDNNTGRDSRGRFTKGNHLGKQFEEGNTIGKATQFTFGNTIGKNTWFTEGNPMQFTDEHPKIGGRREGTPNRTTVALDQLINDILIGYYDSPSQGVWDNPLFLEDFNNLGPKLRAKLMIRLVIARLPKNNNVYVSSEDRTQQLLDLWLDNINQPYPLDDDGNPRQ